MSKNVLITGGTGVIGQHVVKQLKSQGHSVRILTRGETQEATQHIHWNPQKGELPEEALSGIDTVIHLAGASIAEKKWTRERKKIIIDSRVQAARLIHEKIASMDSKPTTFISASAIGYYGYDTGSILVKETSRFGDDFLATVSKAWEQEADTFHSLGMRVVKLRFGIVLSETGGALEKMVAPVKLGLGAALGRGDQYISWIHQNDVAAVILHAMATDISDVYNVVAPQPVTNRQFMKAIAETLRKPFFLPNVPGFILKLFLGQQASMVLGGNKVSSEKLSESGFTFQFPKLDEALQNLLKK